MKLLAIDHVRISSFVELLAPWPGGGSCHRPSHHSGKLVHRTPGDDEAPDIRYWTPYDHFMSEYEVRVQRAAYFHGVLRSALRKLSLTLARLAGRAPNRTPAAN
jgi:hypothetical protein